MRPADFATLARFHPQMALAIDDGVPARPNVRTLRADFSTASPGGPVVPQSFSEIFGTFAVFTEANVTIDPTGAFAGSPLKTISDTFQAMTSGITVTLMVKGGGGVDYAVMPDDTPLQSVPKALDSSAYIWSLTAPDNVKAFFTIAAQQIGTPPFSVWIVMTFLQLGGNGGDYLRMPHADAISALQRRGILPAPMPG